MLKRDNPITYLEVKSSIFPEEFFRFTRIKTSQKENFFCGYIIYDYSIF